MKIGYLLQAEEEIRKPPYNGPANHIRQVVFEFQRQGHQVLVLARLQGKLWESEDLESFRPIIVNGIDSGPLHWIEKIIRRVQAVLSFPTLDFLRACALHWRAVKNSGLVICSWREQVGWDTGVL